jgi:hypothetical protein
MAARLLLGEEEEEQKHVLPFAPKSSSKLRPVAHFTAEGDPLFFFFCSEREEKVFSHTIIVHSVTFPSARFMRLLRTYLRTRAFRRLYLIIRTMNVKD